MTVGEIEELQQLAIHDDGQPLCPPRHVSLRQWLVLLRLLQHDAAAIRTTALMTKWQAMGVPWCAPAGVRNPAKVLRAIVGRLNKSLSLSGARHPTVDDLESQFGSWRRDVHTHVQALQLCAYPSATLSEQESFFPVTCRAMLRSMLQHVNADIAISIDGKVQTLSNKWEILTIGFLHRSPAPRGTVLRRLQSAPHASKGVRTQKRWAMTVSRRVTSFAPIIQCVTMSESSRVVGALFCLLLSELKHIDPQSDWTRRIVMLCRDQSSSIEAARRECLPFARPLSDYAHFTRKVYTKVKRWHALRELVVPFYRATMQAPTVEIFSTVWQLFRDWLQQQPAYTAFVNYLFRTSTYFDLYAVSQLRSWTCISLHDSTSGKLLWSPVHRGIFAILPGSAAGNQPVEAFHNGSMAPLSHAVSKGAPAATALDNLDKAYPKWDVRFGWSNETSYSLVQTRTDAGIFRGLTQVGRSSPHDFFFHRLTQNHQIIQDGDTCYVTMWCRKLRFDEELPAKRKMSLDETLVPRDTIKTRSSRRFTCSNLRVIMLLNDLRTCRMESECQPTTNTFCKFRLITTAYVFSLRLNQCAVVLLRAGRQLKRSHEACMLVTRIPDKFNQAHRMTTAHHLDRLCLRTRSHTLPSMPLRKWRRGW